jgi:hypothetical protein
MSRQTFVCFRALVVCALSTLSGSPAFAFIEAAVQCLGASASPPRDFAPAIWGIFQDADSSSRTVGMVMRWDASPASALNTSFGLEFKTYNYNYDNAAATGKGPAFVLEPSGLSYCELPGCYLDSDFGSRPNSTLIEKREPQVNFGMYAGNAPQIQPGRVYINWTRAKSGRGDRALLKARIHVTKEVLPIGVSGQFLCEDVPPVEAIRFQQGFYSPTCLVYNTKTGLASSCGQPQVSAYPLGISPPADPVPPQPPASPPPTSPPGPPSPPPPGPACAGQVQRSGGGEGLSIEHDFGSAAGVISLEFEAYGVPDGFSIASGTTNQQLIDLGSGSGLRKATFNFNPSASGQRLRLRVDANQTEATFWQLRVSCPGQPIQLPVPQRSVRFSVVGDTCGVNWTVSVNGSPPASPTFFRTLSVGPGHSIKASWTKPGVGFAASCGGTANTYPGNIQVDDGRGARDVVGGYSTQGLFEVRP